MRAAVLAQQGAPLTVTDAPDPTPGAGEVVLRVEACGICGSDLHASDALPLDGMILGHEFCGTVAELGAGVEGWAVGDRAAGLSLATCGQCVACRTGRPRKCPTARMIGMELPGAYAEHVALWLRRLGAREVIVSDPVEHRRQLAVAVGASATIDPTTQDVTDEVVALTGAPPSLVIECVGVPGLLQHATDVAAVDGRVVVSGVCMAEDPLVPIIPMMKELDLRFAFYYRTADYTTTIDLMARELLDPLPLVTAEIGLDEVPERFASLKHPTTDCKVLIRP